MTAIDFAKEKGEMQQHAFIEKRQGNVLVKHWRTHWHNNDNKPQDTLLSNRSHKK